MSQNRSARSGAFGQSLDNQIEALQQALDVVTHDSERVRRWIGERAVRLAESGSPAVFPVLVRYCHLVEETTVFAPWLAHSQQPAEQLESRALVELLALLRRYPSPQALVVAQTLVARAERSPDPVLAEALPLLHPVWNTPLAFVGLRRRLRAALTLNLPLPAAARPTTENLPRPAGERDENPVSPA